jgi:integrase
MRGNLARMLAGLPDSRAGQRDGALLLAGYAGAFRSSELVAVDVSDLHWSAQGSIRPAPGNRRTRVPVSIAWSTRRPANANKVTPTRALSESPTTWARPPWARVGMSSATRAAASFIVNGPASWLWPCSGRSGTRQW